MFIQDDKLPDDVVRQRHSNRRHALCCLNRGPAVYEGIHAWART
jgi:hypothetical protein